jgi:hypothetical protein
MAQPDPLVLCSIPLTVMPASDLSLFGDRPGVGWSWRAEGKASVDTASTAAAFQGTGSLAVQASGPWKVFCETARPVDRLGYVSLNLAVLPGETAPTAIEVGLNLNKRRSIAKLVNWADRSWQQVSLPLDSLGLGPYESIASILLYGGPKGSFSVDDVKLVALPPPAPPTAVLEAWTGAVPGAFALLQNYPNPFNSGTVIAYNLPAPDEVALTVHNLVGQQVAILTQGARQAGAHVLTWDGRDGNGRPLASGIYVYRLQTKAQQQTRKLLLLR